MTAAIHDRGTMGALMRRIDLLSRALLSRAKGLASSLRPGLAAPDSLLGGLGLALATLRNVASRGMNRELIGFTLSERVGPVDAASALAYAVATNDGGAYGDGETPPLYIARLVQSLFMRLITLPGLHLNLLRMVHAEQRVVWHAPLRVGDEVDISLQVADITETAAGELLHLRFVGAREGETLVEGRIGLMVRGGGRRPLRPKVSASHDAERPAPAFIVTMPTAGDQALRYADASGDHNVIHKSELFARLAGLPRTILHGMCVLAMTTGKLADTLVDGDRGRLESVELRFAKPTLPGDVLRLVIYPGTDDGFPFEVLNERDQVILKRGLVRTR